MENDNGYGPKAIKKSVDALVALAPQFEPLTIPFNSTYFLFNQWRTSARIERLEDVVKDVTASIEVMGEAKLDRDFIRSNDGQQLILEILESAVSKRSSASRECFKKILVKLIDNSYEKPSWTDLDMYLDLLNNLKEVHIIVLGFLAKEDWSEKEFEKLLTEWTFLHSTSSKHVLRNALNALVNAALVHPVTATTVGNIGLPASYFVTDLGKSFYYYCIA